MRYKAEYIWIDGTRPTAKLLSPVSVDDPLRIDIAATPSLTQLP
jgi:hypothetical protein